MFMSMAIVPGKFDLDNFDIFDADRMRRRIRQSARGHGLVAHNKLRGLVSTWHHKVNFHYEVHDTPDGIEIKITTDDAIFFYLDQGTRVRYATMTEDFVPKTTVRSLKSGPGVGGLAYVDINNPRPGIKAREFMDEIVKNRQKPFDESIERIINEELRRFFR